MSLPICVKATACRPRALQTERLRRECADCLRRWRSRRPRQRCLSPSRRIYGASRVIGRLSLWGELPEALRYGAFLYIGPDRNASFHYALRRNALITLSRHAQWQLARRALAMRSDISELFEPSTTLSAKARAIIASINPAHSSMGLA